MKETERDQSTSVLELRRPGVSAIHGRNDILYYVAYAQDRWHSTCYRSDTRANMVSRALECAYYILEQNQQLFIEKQFPEFKHLRKFPTS